MFGSVRSDKSQLAQKLVAKIIFIKPAKGISQQVHKQLDSRVLQ
jgi:hypothetical protein